VGGIAEKETLQGRHKMKETIHSFKPGTPFLVDSTSLNRRWATVFEDDGETAHFYALDLGEEKHSRNPVQETLQIYNVATLTHADGTFSISIIWSEDGHKACLLINANPHAIFDFEAKRGYCRTRCPPPAKWNAHDFAWDDRAMEFFKNS